MSYSLYIHLLTQIVFENKAKLSCEGETIDVVQHSEGYTLSTKLGPAMPKELSYRQTFNCDSDAELVLKREGLYLVQQVKNLDKFISFKNLIHNHITLISFYRQILQEFLIR